MLRDCEGCNLLDVNAVQKGCCICVTFCLHWLNMTTTSQLRIWVTALLLAWGGVASAQGPLAQGWGVGVDVSRLLGGHAVIQVDQQGQNSIVIAGGTNRQLPMELIDRAVAAVADGDWLLLQNETNDVDTAIRGAAATSGRVALNLAPPDMRIGDYPIGDLDLLIVNEAEANALAGTSSSGAALRTLMEQYPEVSLLLTMGGEGLYLYDSIDGVAQAMGAFAVTPVDETAAGDSFVGYLMASLVAGENLPDAVLRASAAGAVAVTRAGAAPSIPSIDEVGSLIEQQTPSFELREIDPGDLA